MFSAIVPRFRRFIQVAQAETIAKIRNFPRTVYDSIGGDETVALIRRILIYTCIVAAIVIGVALLILASFGLAAVFAFFTRQYILYDLPVSSVHHVDDWAAYPRYAEQWRLHTELDDISTSSSNSLLGSVSRLQTLRAAASGIASNVGDSAEAALVELYKNSAAVKTDYLHRAMSALIGTGLVKLQPIGWRTRNNWHPPLEFDDDSLDGVGASSGSTGAKGGASWFVNDDAIFSPSGPRFSQIASYSAMLRIVTACPISSFSQVSYGAVIGVEATMLIANDDRPQPLHSLLPLFHKSRLASIPSQGYLWYTARWAINIVMYPIQFVWQLLSYIMLWRSDDLVLVKAAQMLADECSVDVPLYTGFVPPKDLLQRLRVLNISMFSSPSPTSEDAKVVPPQSPLEVRRMYFFHEVEHFGLAFLFSEYPLSTMWVTTIVWFSILVTSVVIGAVAIGIVGYNSVAQRSQFTPDETDYADNEDRRTRRRYRRTQEDDDEDDPAEHIPEQHFDNRFPEEAPVGEEYVEPADTKGPRVSRHPAGDNMERPSAGGSGRSRPSPREEQDAGKQQHVPPTAETHLRHHRPKR